MAMKNPTHPGYEVKEALDTLGVSVANAADAMGVHRTQLHRVIRGQSGVSPDMAVRLAAAIGSTPAAWLAMQAAYDLAHVEIGGRVRRLVAA